MNLSKVFVFRFLNDDLLGEVVKETETELTVKNIVRVVIIPNPAKQNNPGVGFVPFMEWSSDDTFTLSKSLMLCKATPIKQFIEKYQEQFSNIIIPGSQGLQANPSNQKHLSNALNSR